MTNPDAFQRSFRLGMKRDFPRSQLPSGSAWTIRDFLIDTEGYPLLERYGTQYWFTPIGSATASTANAVVGGMYAPFKVAGKNLFWYQPASGANQIWRVTNDGYSTITAATALSSIGTGFDETHPVFSEPVFFNDKMILPANTTGTTGGYITSVSMTAANSFSATALTAAPIGSLLGVHNGAYLMVSGVTAQPQRLYFCSAYDETTWDATSYIDLSGDVLGFRSVAGVIIVITTNGVARIKGTTPPPGGNMTLEEPWVGQIRHTGNVHRSMYVYRDELWYANRETVYTTDGITWWDAASRADMRQLWQSRQKTQAYIGSFSDYLFVAWEATAGNDDGSIFMVDTKSGAWTELDGNFYGPFFNVQGEYGTWDCVQATTSAYVQGLGTMFGDYGQQYNYDANGTKITPMLETAFYSGEPGEKRFKNVYVGYAMTDGASSTDTVALTFTFDPAAMAYAQGAQPGELPVTGGVYNRYSRDVHQKAPGVAFKLLKVCTDATRLGVFDIGGEVYPAEGSFRRQRT